MVLEYSICVSQTILTCTQNKVILVAGVLFGFLKTYHLNMLQY